jgi:hypothetical protein
MIYYLLILIKSVKFKFVGDHVLMAESPTFYSAFGPCMDRLKEMYKHGQLNAHGQFHIILHVK